MAVVVWVVIMVVLAWFIVQVFTEQTAKPTEQRVQQVSTAVPSHRELRSTATVPGAWVAREEVAVGSPLEGLRVAQVLVESGDPVSLGQVLVRLERTILDSQARQAEQSARRTHAEFTQANEQYERVQRLLPAGAVSRQDFEAARASMLVAKAALQQAQAAWDEQQARQAQTEIRAPFAGTITQRAIQVGAMVGPQSTLFRLAGNQPLEFQVQVPQQLLPELIVGMTALVSTSGREGASAGTVRLISTGVDTATGYGQSRIAMTAVPSPSIRPGSIGNARITLTQRNVLAVDIRALRYTAQPGQDQEHAQPYVFVVDAGRARRTPVQVGMREDGWVEVRTGLDTQSRVVITGASLLQDGDAVQQQDIETASNAIELRRTTLWRISRHLLRIESQRSESLMASLTVSIRA